MSTDRLIRVNALLKREIAAAVPSIMAGTDVPLAAVMISDVVCASNLRHARVSVSIFGHENERGHIVSKFNSHRADFQRIIAKSDSLKYTPVLSFVLDNAIEKGDHVLDLLSKLS